MKALVNNIIENSISLNASDVHFIPNESIVHVKLRINGKICAGESLEHSIYLRLLAYMKFVSNLDVSERKKAQSGLFTLDVQDDKYNIRISTLPQSIGNEAAVLRILPVSFKDDHTMTYKALYEAMKLSHGLILITGPTGSGKSTMMYHLLKFARDELNRQIITIEDPVEQQLEGTIQINVNDKADITYQNSFKAILRCDPDIIMIGEIRDSVTAKQVINAALSGHLIVSTLHASDTEGAVERLQEMGIQKSELKQTIKMITSQRLVASFNERRLVMEMMDRKMLIQLLNNEKLEQLTIRHQISRLYNEKIIDIEELERFDFE